MFKDWKPVINGKGSICLSVLLLYIYMYKSPSSSTGMRYQLVQSCVITSKSRSRKNDGDIEERVYRQQ